MKLTKLLKEIKLVKNKIDAEVIHKSSSKDHPNLNIVFYLDEYKYGGVASTLNKTVEIIPSTIDSNQFIINYFDQNKIPYEINYNIIEIPIVYFNFK
jgi:hypothetical protein